MNALLIPGVEFAYVYIYVMVITFNKLLCEFKYYLRETIGDCDEILKKKYSGNLDYIV